MISLQPALERFSALRAPAAAIAALPLLLLALLPPALGRQAARHELAEVDRAVAVDCFGDVWWWWMVVDGG